MAELTLWLAAGMILSLPADWRLERTQRDTVPTPIPGESVGELFCRWVSPQGATLHLFWWTAAQPPRPGGPLVARENWEARLAGQPVEVLRTSQFQGRQQEVLVTHWSDKARPAALMLYGEGLPPDQFDALLAWARFAAPAGEDLSCRRLAGVASNKAAR